MSEKRNSDFKVAPVPLSDDALEEVTGGYFGKTEHTVFLNSKTYNMWVGKSMDQVALFGAGWAHPCVLLNETMEMLAAENPNTSVAIVDVDENPDFWKVGGRDYIEFIPTVIKFHDGFEVTRIVGNQKLETFKKLF